MSQSSNQVAWCLNKAKRELEEAKKQGKRQKHRGLLEVKPNIDEARKYMAKAEHNLKGLSYFNKGGFSDWSITAGFYCIYHCFLAICLKFGYESKNQICTVSLIEHLREEGKISIDQKFIDLIKFEDIEERHESNVIEMREECTYGTETSADQVKIKELIDNCKKVIDICKEIVYKN